MQTIVDELNKITHEQAETISEAIEDLGEDIEAAVELPANPSEDGTYTLKVTIADGAATLAWVKDV